MKTTLRIVLVAACLVFSVLAVACAYLFGYHRGSNAELRATVAGSMFYSAGVYSSLERGDIQKMKSTLGITMLTYTRKYQQLFRKEAAENHSALYQYARAKCDEIEHELVPLSSITTNLPHTPDAKVTIEKRQ